VTEDSEAPSAAQTLRSKPVSTALAPRQSPPFTSLPSALNAASTGSSAVGERSSQRVRDRRSRNAEGWEVTEDSEAPSAARTLRSKPVSTPLAPRQSPPFTSPPSALNAASAGSSAVGERSSQRVRDRRSRNAEGWEVTEDSEAPSAARTLRSKPVSTPLAPRQSPPFTSPSSALNAASAAPSAVGERSVVAAGPSAFGQGVGLPSWRLRSGHPRSFLASTSERLSAATRTARPLSPTQPTHANPVPPRYPTRPSEVPMRPLALTLLLLPACGTSEPAACTSEIAVGGETVITCPGSEPVVVQNGQDGDSCTVADNGDGTATITCEDGSTVVITDGAPGEDCAVSDNGDGTWTLDCPGSDPVTLLDADSVCRVLDNGDGTHDLLCPGADPVTLEDAAACSLTDNGDGTWTYDCPTTDPVTFGTPPGCVLTDLGDGTATLECPGSATLTFTVGGVAVPCVLDDNGDGTATLTCPGSDPITWIIEPPTCTLTDNGDATYTFACTGQAPITFSTAVLRADRPRRRHRHPGLPRRRAGHVVHPGLHVPRHRPGRRELAARLPRPAVRRRRRHHLRRQLRARRQHHLRLPRPGPGRPPAARRPVRRDRPGRRHPRARLPRLRPGHPVPAGPVRGDRQRRRQLHADLPRLRPRHPHRRLDARAVRRRRPRRRHLHPHLPRRRPRHLDRRRELRAGR
jgi:hypothetical protein